MRPRLKQTQIPEGALEVLGYFVRNPLAADTLEGVARWRLLEQDIHRCVREADDAMAWLVEHGFLRREGSEQDGHPEPLFRLNEEMVGFVRQLLLRGEARRATGRRQREGAETAAGALPRLHRDQ